MSHKMYLQYFDMQSIVFFFFIKLPKQKYLPINQIDKISKKFDTAEIKLSTVVAILKLNLAFLFMVPDFKCYKFQMICDHELKLVNRNQMGTYEWMTGPDYSQLMP